MLLKRLQRLSKGLSRKQKGSRNRQKAKSKLANLHARLKDPLILIDKKLI
jgi:putative transposase